VLGKCKQSIYFIFIIGNILLFILFLLQFLILWWAVKLLNA